jgi:hypothetical protein
MNMKNIIICVSAGIAFLGLGVSDAFSSPCSGPRPSCYPCCERDFTKTMNLAETTRDDCKFEAVIECGLIGIGIALASGDAADGIVACATCLVAKIKVCNDDYAEKRNAADQALGACLGGCDTE